MTLCRLDLDGLGSPSMIAARIHALEPDMPLAVPVEDLCRKLDIVAVEDIHTEGFEAALVMDEHKAAGSILVAAGRSRQRRRYSIGHELGHFLLPTHMPRPGEGFECSLADLHLLDAREQDRRKRIEAEANRFAAALLMPKVRVRAAAVSPAPNLQEVVQLARTFDVSKEAMGRAYIDAHREALAMVILRHSRLLRIYRHPEHFPWIAARVGQPTPAGSIAEAHRLNPGEVSDIEECEAQVWLGERDSRNVEVMTEQLLGQRDGFAMLLLHAELIDEDDAD